MTGLKRSKARLIYACLREGGGKAAAKLRRRTKRPGQAAAIWPQTNGTATEDCREAGETRAVGMEGKPVMALD
jgi:hypothetical protein